MEKYTIHFQGTKIDGGKGPEELINIYAFSYDNKVAQADFIAKEMLKDNEEYWEIRWEDVNYGQGHYISDFDRVLFTKGGDKF